MLKALARIGSLIVAAASFGTLSLQPASADEVRSCAASRSDASTISAAQPDYPMLAQLMDATGTAVVKVDLLATGAIANATIARSSGNRYLDKAALEATFASQFRAEARNCSSIPGSYLFVVSFDR